MKNHLSLILFFVCTHFMSAQPAWDFDYRQYEYSMNINAVLQLNDTLYENSSNVIVAAFDKNGNVIGKAEPFYYQSIGKYRVPLAVFGNVQNDSVFFQVYVSDLNTIFYLHQSMVFVADEIIGHFEQPFVLNLDDGVVSDKEQLKLFPNPAVDIINLKGNDDDVLRELVVYNIAGKAVLRLNAALSNLEIDISGLSPGTYFFKADANIKPLKFVKK